MSNEVKVFNLVGEAKDFVFSNLDVLKSHLIVIFPFVLLFELINNFGEAFGATWVALLTFIPILYLYGCFALSWHRSSLMGASPDHAVNPLELRPENKGFILLFFGVAGLPFLFGILMGAGVGLASVGGEIALGIALIIAIPVSIWGIIQLIRISFLLPARSVDVKLSLADARRASRGLIGKIFLSGVVVTFAFSLVIMLYALIVGLVVGIITTGSEPSPLTTGLTMFILGIPMIVAGFVYTAINVTILSRAYQWGIQNNA